MTIAFKPSEITRFLSGFYINGFGASAVIFYTLFTFAAIGFAGTYSGGSGSAEDPYKISTVADWQELIAKSADWNKNFILINDIDFGGINLSPVAPLWVSGGFLVGTRFTGVFDGKEHTLSNATINASSYTGLFGGLRSPGQIMNLRVDKIDVTGSKYVGGICGINGNDGDGGIIKSCSYNGTIQRQSGSYNMGGICGRNQGTISDCLFIGTIIGGEESRYIGGICGWHNSGTMSGCSSTGAISSGNNSEDIGNLCGSAYGTVTDCFSTGPVTVGNQASCIGGLCGYQSGTMESCYSASSINSGDNSMAIGGLCGWQRGTIINCIATGKVSGGNSSKYLGGLFGNGKDSGSQERLIKGCYATGAVSGGENSEYLGGLCGYNYDLTTIKHCYSFGTVSGGEGSKYIGGLCGYTLYGPISYSYWDIQRSGISSSNGGKGLSTSQMKTLRIFQNAGWGSSGWVMEDGMDYPRLAWENTGAPAIPIYGDFTLIGSGTPDDPYQISTPDEFAALSEIAVIFDKKFCLMANLDFGGQPLFPIGDPGSPFTGLFEGNGYCIQNPRINMPDLTYVGLFGCLGSGGEIRNLNLDSVDIHGGYWVGGICASNIQGKIHNCSMIGTISGIGGAGGICGDNSGTISACSTSGSISGKYGLGGLCGRNGYADLSDGTIFGCFSDMDVNGEDGSHSLGGLCGGSSGLISDCYAKGTIKGLGPSYCLGGLCGINDGTIGSCHASGPISGHHHVGGLCGRNEGIISNCFATGAVQGGSVGGLCGSHVNGTIQNCYAKGSVTGNEEIGGLCGYADSTINYCYATGSVTRGAVYSGGLIGNNEGYSTVHSCFWDIQTSGITCCNGGSGISTIEMQSYLTFASAGWDFSGTWWIPAGDYPRLLWEEGMEIAYGSLEGSILPAKVLEDGAQWRRVGTTVWLDNNQIEESVPTGYWMVEFKPLSGWRRPDPIPVLISGNSTSYVEGVYKEIIFSGGSGSVEDPYQISSVADWQMLIDAESDWDKRYTLINNIDFCGARLTPISPDIDPIGYNSYQGIPFAGVFNGNGHLLKNAFIDSPNGEDFVGLFGRLGPSGEIKNLGIESISISGQYCVGCLCGENEGQISRCYVMVNVKGGYYVGGLCGWNDGQISSSYASASVSGSGDIGGLVGYHCGKLNHCHSTGFVSGSRYIGGLCGSGSGGSAFACFWDTETSGIISSYGGIGISTKAMKKLTTFTQYGWDFVGESANGTADFWRMCADGVNYPRLSWEFSQGGDMDCPDGVAMEDLVYLAGRWMAGTSTTVGAADANSDGRVDLGDFILLSEQWMK